MFLALGFGQSSQELKKSFEVTQAPDETVDGQKRTVLDLKPRNTSQFKSIRIWLDQKAWHAVQIKTVEKNNDYLLVKFTDVKMNAGIPDSRFKLDMPKDVKVIKM
jgi:outer membrane lipoprotein-sorting protein